MAYDNNPNDPMNRDNYQLKNKLNESEDQRTRRQNRIGAVILGFVVLAFIGGYIATTDKHAENAAVTPTTAMNTAPTGTTEAAIAPASGTAGTSEANGIPTNQSPAESAVNTTASSGDMTGSGVNSTPEASGPAMAANETGSNTSTATTGATTQPVTENPKVYTTEDSCRSIVGGACQPVSGGWTPVNPAPDKAAVPEAMAPAMTATSPSDSTTK